MLVVDLDPGPPAGILDAAGVALRVRRILDRLGLRPHVKTTGSLGLHVLARVPGGTTFEETKALARRLAGHLRKRSRGDVVDVADRRARPGRVFLDWVQNDPTRSTVAPYSLRAMPWPMVATPITWDELETAVRARNARSLWFSPREVLERLDRLGDLAVDLA
jgi:bifunctional non-homologous end joining protein LigD